MTAAQLRHYGVPEKEAQEIEEEDKLPRYVYEFFKISIEDPGGASMRTVRRFPRPLDLPRNSISIFSP